MMPVWKRPGALFLYRNKNWATQYLHMQDGGGSLSDGARG